MLKPLVAATVLLTAGCAPAPQSAAPVQVPAVPAQAASAQRPATHNTNEARRIVFNVFYPDSKHPEYQRTCGALSGVPRELDSAERTPLRFMQVLFEGPTREEVARGLQDPFGPASTFNRDERRLSAYLTGARIEGRRVILSFQSPAMNWLNNTSCVQEAVKMPIDRTLREAFPVDGADYEIDGHIVKEWDA